jgi:hypothetical protein
MTKGYAMQSQQVSISQRFCGPSRSGNGGYVCGLIAGPIKGPAAVKLFVPPPLNAVLTLQSTSDSAKLLADETLVGEARAAQLDITPPPAPSYADAEAAVKQYSGFHTHPFPNCFVCGPKRNEGDGLHIFTGAVTGTNIVASPWLVHESLAVDGKVPDKFIWAALDCPGAFALPVDMGKVAIVLGQLTARIEKSVSAGQRCIVIGWPIASEGRKHIAGSAVFSDKGHLIAEAKATWIEVARELFEPDPQ